MNTGSLRAGPRWYRSLYWRATIALIALVALMLVAEGSLFLWLSVRTAGAMPARDPRQMARLVASDLGTALEANPKLDVQQYLRDQYGHIFQSLLVLGRDGTVVANHDDVRPSVMEAARFAAMRPIRRFDGRGGGPGSPGGGPGGPGGRRPDRGFDEPSFRDDRRFRPPDLRAEVTTILVGGEPYGRVALANEPPPFSRIVRIVGPTMALVAGGVLIVGGALIALIIFKPARQRLQQVQAATELLGAGDLRARVPEQGHDEVAAVARSFNRMADELAERASALEASDNARRQLLADVSHELMTPLTAMRGYIETLTMAELQIDPPTRERYMRIVTEETHRLEHIIGDLLDLARLEGGGTSMRQEEVPIEMLFERVGERHERELIARRVELARRIAPGAELVEGDPDRLEQVFQNLVANALRYTPDDGQIALLAERSGDDVRITVSDTGPGIPDAQLPLIFDRFYKADASRKQAGGSGLGLSIVKAIIERHGGTVTARNEGGAVFEITLPSFHTPLSGVATVASGRRDERPLAEPQPR
jgi:signal transduction histidine kinase